MLSKNLISPVHPGEILLEDFMKPEGISVQALASELKVPVIQLSAIVDETTPITGEMALRLGRYFSTTGEFWMNLQSRFDLDVATDSSHREIEKSIQPRNAA